MLYRSSVVSDIFLDTFNYHTCVGLSNFFDCLLYLLCCPVNIVEADWLLRES